MQPLPIGANELVDSRGATIAAEMRTQELVATSQVLLQRRMMIWDGWRRLRGKGFGGRATHMTAGGIALQFAIR